MSKTVESKNKALDLEAFDTLFNKRGYEATAKFWPDTNMRHSAHSEPRRTAGWLADPSPARPYCQLDDGQALWRSAPLFWDNFQSPPPANPKAFRSTAKLTRFISALATWSGPVAMAAGLDDLCKR
jgi:hypothetical protein